MSEYNFRNRNKLGVKEAMICYMNIIRSLVVSHVILEALKALDISKYSFQFFFNLSRQR